ncbi:MAG: transcriptional repressor [Acidobacteriota bacterium]|nr:transcriptional repressor [Acidobacteriota bacterium]
MSKGTEEFKKERALFQDHIKNAGLRRTAQRDLILEVFLRTEDHLASEDLYWLVQKRDPNVGQTTVYRTLKLLTDAGLAREVRLGDGRTYYEHHFDHEHHDHMICTECGEVIEFFCEEIEKLQDEMAEQFGFTPTHHSMRILGFCSKCKKTDKKQSPAASGAQPRVKVKTTIN